ncbi:hypothetical protein [Staphylococcus felis]|uniref:hypothetical protein n=1 Tax=Staphylococcus felis TaxID=46127 RepID=UPI00142DE12A|nr:hypothetical protein [Staphylococcus felis]QQB02603.1 hypothetical protein I6H71_07545 [Staphylococcus felis]
MKEYSVEIEYYGMIEIPIEAETAEEAYDLAQDTAMMEIPFESDVLSISVLEN